MPFRRDGRRNAIRCAAGVAREPRMTESLDERVLDAIGDHYELEEEIGRGGMSVVYRARDRRLNRVVAIKVLPPELAYDPAIRTRFTREAQTSARLAHPHIVPIYDVGDRDGIAYFVMAFVAGGNLATHLAREPHRSADEVRRILCEVSDALAYAHLRGVIHRDIKPDNILLDEESGRAMVTDFGIARAIEAGTRLTVTGNAVGTPTYMSPEQAVGDKEIDGRSDIYSLGVVAYQMLTGRVPFTAGNSMALLLKHVSETARPIAELRPDAPRALREAVERAMTKSPEDRWPTAASLRDALSSREPASPSWRSEHREPVRYLSPRPDSRAASAARRSAPSGEVSRPALPAAVVVQGPSGTIVMEQAHLAGLTTEQRADLRLWHGRVNLLDRVKSMRRYSVLTFAAIVGGMVGFVGGVDQMPPFILAPLVSFHFMRKWWRRGKSLRASGLRLRRVLFMPTARRVFPTVPPSAEQRLESLAPREILDGPHGTVVRRAAEDRAVILEIAANLPPADREVLPGLDTTVNALVQRVVNLAQMLHRLDLSIDPRLKDDLDARIASVGAEAEAPEGERRITLLHRQRATIEELMQRRAALARQLDSAGLALGNLRLDLIKFRSSGLQSALSDVTSATQEVKALSRDIDAMLEAVAEVKRL
jgi:serine/threonine protein kinase